MAHITLTNLDPLHWLLAYAGALLHVLKSIAKARTYPGFGLVKWVKANFLSMLINAIMIPVVLIVITETSLQDTLPINYLTALLAGYQTQDMFDALVGIGKKKYIDTNTDQQPDAG